MKKSIIIVVVILVVIAILPTIGNSIIKKVIDEKVLEFKNSGIETKVDKTNSSYLSTSRHFELLLKDSAKIFKNFNVQSNKGVDVYAHKLLDGMVVGMDIKYNNLPFSKAIEIEIYPLKISESMKSSLEKEDIRVYRYLKTFFKLKRIFCHVNYNLLNDKFDGYLNDIDENFKLKDETVAKVKITKLIFSGTNKLKESEILNSSVKELSFSMSKKDKKMSIVFDKFKSSNKFELKKGYTNSVKLKNFTFVTGGTSRDININLEQLKAKSYLDTKGVSIKIDSDASVKSLKFNSRDMAFELKGLNFDTSINGLDKKEFKKLEAITVDTNTDDLTALLKEQEKIKKYLIAILSKGLVLSIDDYSFKNINVHKENLEGFSMKVDINIKKDENLQEKLKVSPFLVLGNLDIKIDIKLSKKIYAKLEKIKPSMSYIKQYTKVDKNDVVFNILFKDSKFTVNGKALN